MALAAGTGGPTFPHRLVLLGRLPARGRRRRRRLVQQRRDGLAVRADGARDAHGAVRERGEVHAHEAQDHVVRDVRDVVAGHVRRVEDLAGRRQQGAGEEACAGLRTLT